MGERTGETGARFAATPLPSSLLAAVCIRPRRGFPAGGNTRTEVKHGRQTLPYVYALHGEYPRVATATRTDGRQAWLDDRQTPPARNRPFGGTT